MIEVDPEIGDGRSVNVVVGECNDSYLNDMRGLHVRPEHASQAIKAALQSNSRHEGALGAGTGMTCFGWKGGVGSASRTLEGKSGAHTIGTLVVSNFGSAQDLQINGIRVGDALMPPTRSPDTSINEPSVADGSIMIVIGTDLPLTQGGLLRLAKRAVVGLARTGSYVSHGSGDIVVAFSTVRVESFVAGFEEDGSLMSEAFRATIEAVEESVLNSLAMAGTTMGKRGRVVTGFPMEHWARLHA